MEAKIIAIVGKSNSGKTTLLEKLVACLADRGYRIGSVKHAHCGFEMDTPGKDSWRHKRAGTAATLVLSEDRAALIKEDTRGPKEKIMDYLDGMDLILVEGFKRAAFQKIEIFRKNGPHETPLFLDPQFNLGQDLIAVVTDAPVAPDVPVFGLEETGPLADFIESRFLKTS